MNLKRILGMLLVAALVGLTVACTPASSTSPNEETGIQIYTSIYPVYDFTSRIVGDRANVKLMIPPGTSTHGWEPSMGDIVKLEKADVFIYHGAGIEHWVAATLSSLENPHLTIVEASQGIDLLTADTADSHDDADDDGHVDTLHGHDAVDPHVWLDPHNVIREAENIRDAMILVDPDGASTYRSNCAAFIADLEALDRDFKETLTDLTHTTIVVGHKAFTYMCHAYGLTQMAVEGLTPNSEPGPGRMKEIIDFLREQDVKTIFFEQAYSTKSIQAIADEVGAEIRVLSPFEGLDEKDYITVMRANLHELSEALR